MANATLREPERGVMRCSKCEKVLVKRHPLCQERRQFTQALSLYIDPDYSPDDSRDDFRKPQLQMASDVNKKRLLHGSNKWLLPTRPENLVFFQLPIRPAVRENKRHF